MRTSTPPSAALLFACAVALGLLATSCSGDSSDVEVNGPVSALSDAEGRPDERVTASRALFSQIDSGEPGCSVAVGHEGQVVYAEAFGAASLDPLRPFTADAIVDIGSTSKQFTAIEVGLQVLSHKVGLEDPVGEYVPRLPEWSSRVTIAQLLTHTSGVRDYVDLLVDEGIDYDQPSDQDDALEALRRSTLGFEPGTKFEYSNGNYLLLAEVVRSATGEDLSDAVGADVFEPLGMDAVIDPAGVIDAKATSYERDGGWVVADSPWTQVGDGGVQTTASELVKFARVYWSAEPLWSQLAQMRSQIGVDDGEGVYSLGIESVELDGETMLSHDGAWAGFETGFLVSPTRHMAVAITCNSPDVGVDTEGYELQLMDLWASADS